MTKGLEILKTLVSQQHLSTVIILKNCLEKSLIVQFCEKFKVNFLLTEFEKEYPFDLISFFLAFEVLKHIEFNRVFFLSTDREYHPYINSVIKTMPSGLIYKEHLREVDQFNAILLNKVFSLCSNFKWNKECLFLESKEYLLKLIKSLPFKYVFKRCLTIDQKYTNFVFPRASPFHSLERLLGYIKPKISKKNKSFVVVYGSLEKEEDLDNLVTSLEFFKDSEIMFFNSGNLKDFNLKRLKINYYYPLQKINCDLETMKLFITAISKINPKDYDNFIYYDCSTSIISNIDEFLERSYYKNTVISLKEGKEVDKTLFSITVESLGSIYKNNKRIRKRI